MHNFFGIGALNRRRAFASNSSLSDVNLGSNSQMILVRDIISEGPIQGLVPQNAVFVNNDTLFSPDSTFTATSNVSDLSASVTSGSTNFTINFTDSFIPTEFVEDQVPVITIFKEADFIATLGTPTVSSSGFGDLVIPTYKYALTAVSGSLPAVIPAKPLGATITNYEEDLPGSIKNESGTLYYVTQSDNLATNGTEYSFATEYKIKVASLNSSGVGVLEEASPVTDSNAKFSIASTVETIRGRDRRGGAVAISTEKYEDATIQFSSGTAFQRPHKSFFGNGVSSIALVPSSDTPLERDTPQYIVGSTAASGAQVSEIDKVLITFQYPAGLYRMEDNGDEFPEMAVYRIEVATSNDAISGGEESTLTYTQIAGNYTCPDPLTTQLSGVNFLIADEGEIAFLHAAKSKEAITFDEVIDLSVFKPFTDFAIKITRLTGHTTNQSSETRSVTKPDPQLSTDGSSSSASKTSNILGLVDEQLNLPFTAHATITFNSKNFSNIPKRQYECYGMRVKIPNNYITREESPNGVASYKRDPATGLLTSNDQFWDGGFRERKTYTNNPAWIFYDIVTNNRYGVGDWLTVNDIDKYSLYKIARYCDELVPDGKGGTEPRFTLNTYLTKATDCYKVLKDLATVFRSILYWADGKLTPVIDAPAEPVYNFSASNIVDGSFNYENTGTKTRANRVIVSWNNPASGYKLEPLIVEDRKNILDTGRIVVDEAVAFGTTSYGQALRFGKWKLWTALNQVEVVSFSTAINAAFLMPGDVINVQDRDEYSIDFSGRISSFSVANKTITLDRDILSSLNFGNTSYTIAILYTDEAVILAQDSATIDGQSYSRGDEIPLASYTDEDIANIFDSSGNLVSVQYNPATTVREYAVESAANTSGKTVLTLVDSPEAPELGTVWGIKGTSSTNVTAESYKQYKILSIKEEQNNVYNIAAVEFYSEKFEAIEEDFAAPIDSYIKPEDSPSIPVPTVEDIIIIKNSEATTSGEEVIVSWIPPGPVLNTGVSNKVYEYISGYEIRHNFFSGLDLETIRVDADTTQIQFNSLRDGSYFLEIKTISTSGRRSKGYVQSIVISDAFGGDAVRVRGIRVGGISDSYLNIDSDTGLAFFKAQPILGPLTEAPAKILALDTSFDCSILDSENLSYGYLLADYSGLSNRTDALKLIESIVDDNKITYWKEIGKSAWSTSLSGTVSIAAVSTKVFGTNTQFLTDFSDLDILYINATTFAKIGYIESDTIMYISDIFEEDITNSAYQKNALSIDYRNDFIIGKIDYNGTSYSKISYLTIDTGLLAESFALFIPIYADDAAGTNKSLSPVGKSFVYFYSYFGDPPVEEDLDSLDLTGVVFTQFEAATALEVTLVSDNAGMVFKNNTGTAKTVTAEVRDTLTGETLTTGLNYRWLIENSVAIIDEVTLEVDMTKTALDVGYVEANGDYPSIIIGAEDVPNEGSIGLLCEVTEAV